MFDWLQPLYTRIKNIFHGAPGEATGGREVPEMANPPPPFPHQHFKQQR